jgi:hypothetical protein
MKSTPPKNSASPKALSRNGEPRFQPALHGQSETVTAFKPLPAALNSGIPIIWSGSAKRSQLLVEETGWSSGGVSTLKIDHEDEMKKKTSDRRIQSPCGT